jgi:hypothetical protein
MTERAIERKSKGRSVAEWLLLTAIVLVASIIELLFRLWFWYFFFVG